MRKTEDCRPKTDDRGLGVVVIRFVGARRGVWREGIAFARFAEVEVPAEIAERLCATSEFERVVPTKAPAPSPVEPGVEEEETNGSG